MKKSVILFLIALSPVFSFAQGVFQFEEEMHNFETIKEGDRAVHEFKFTNVGDQPIVISQVKASCGCTTPFWTKEPVMPGDQGSVKASYNSRGRPGNFHKSITITSNSSTPTKVLQIKGMVEREPPKPKYTEEELAASPVLTIDKSEYNLGTVEIGQNIVKKITVENTGKSELTINSLRSKCNCVSFLKSPKAIPAGGSESFEFSYIPKAVFEGNEVISLYSNDITKPAQKIKFKVSVVESLGGSSFMGGSK